MPKKAFAFSMMSVRGTLVLSERLEAATMQYTGVAPFSVGVYSNDVGGSYTSVQLVAPCKS